MNADTDLELLKSLLSLRKKIRMRGMNSSNFGSLTLFLSRDGREDLFLQRCYDFQSRSCCALCVILVRYWITKIDPKSAGKPQLNCK